VGIMHSGFQQNFQLLQSWTQESNFYEVKN
jgi:hypothetical protein